MTEPLLDQVKQILGRFAEEGTIIAGEDRWLWYEARIFNETRLYKALGKDDARAVLGIWRRFKEVCQLLALEVILPTRVYHT